jgi:hypothetical protein
VSSHITAPDRWKLLTGGKADRETVS